MTMSLSARLTTVNYLLGLHERLYPLPDELVILYRPEIVLDIVGRCWWHGFIGWDECMLVEELAEYIRGK